MLVHIPMTYVSDNRVVAPTVAEQSLLDCLKMHYYSNGRIVTDVVANAFYRMPMGIWKLFDVVVYLLTSILIVHLFTDKGWKDVLFTCILNMKRENVDLNI